MLEVEVKLQICLPEVEEKLIQLGFSRTGKSYEKDVYYNSEVKNLWAEDKALRIREYRDLDTGMTQILANYKGPKLDTSTMTREETEFEVPSWDAADTMYRGLGFAPAGEVEKTRVHYANGGVTCCLDTVTRLGEFMEVEIITEEAGYEQAVERIEELLHQLGYTMEDTTRKSYLSRLVGLES